MRNRNHIFILFLLLILFAPLAHANSNIQGWCENGNQPVIFSGLSSTTLVQQSYPACTVTVFIRGGGLATIYSDNGNTPLANPFTAAVNGRWQFYVANGRYDVQLSGGGISTPITYSDMIVTDPQGGSLVWQGTQDFSGAIVILPNSIYNVNSTPLISTAGINFQSSSVGAGQVVASNPSANIVTFSLPNVAGGGTSLLAMTLGGDLNGDIATKVSGVWTFRTPGVSGQQLSADYAAVCTPGSSDRGTANPLSTNNIFTLPNPAAPGCGSNYYIRTAFQNSAGGTLKATTATINTIAGATGIPMRGGTWCDAASPDNILYIAYCARNVIAGVGLGESISASQVVTVNMISLATATNCNPGSSVSPAACSSASSGVIVVPTTTTTYTVNTTAVTANSRIILEPITDNSGITGSPTCVAPPTPFTAYPSARSAGTSFTFTLPSTAGASCWNYILVN